VSEVFKTALCTAPKWCERTNLSIKPNKTQIIPFTTKKHIKGLKEPITFSKTIQLSSEVKYLGIRLDKELTWKKQLEKIIDRAYKAFWTCRGTSGKLGTETKGDILDKQCGSETHSYLCCHCMVAQSQTQKKQGRT
jgi:hypothetical protein